MRTRLVTRVLRLLLVGLAVTAAALPAHAQPADSRSVAAITTALSQDRVRPGDRIRAAVLIELQPGWHINAHHPRDAFLIPTAVALGPHPVLHVRSIQYPQPLRRRFRFAKRALEVYEGRVPILIEAEVRPTTAMLGTLTLSGTLSIQACDQTTCLAPAEIPLAIPVTLVAADQAVASLHPELFGAAPSGASATAQAGGFGDLLTAHGTWLGLLIVFLGGLALNLTPCVFPMIPVTVAFFSGQAAGRAGYATRLGVVYVLGMSLTYAILGVAAAKTGALLGSWLQQPLVLVGLAGLVTALALSMFGFYELRPPRWVAQRFGEAQSGTVGALVMGLTVGLIAAPCIGPFVLGLLVFVSQLANPWVGFGIFLTLGLGMGLPYVVVGAIANQMGRWPKAGAWLVWVKKALGVVLLGLALYFLKPAVAAVMPAAPPRPPAPARAIGGPGPRAAAWQPYSPERLAQALRDGRPVLVDIYADWCVPCMEMDRVTFRHPDVKQALTAFSTLRVDATQSVPSNAEDLLARYQVFGVPTLLVFDAKGHERPDLRVNGFVPPKELLARLAKARGSS